MIANLLSLVSVLRAAWSSGFSLGTIASALEKYGPLIIALVEFIESQRADEEHAKIATDLERGFHEAMQTDDTTALQATIAAIRKRPGGRL